MAFEYFNIPDYCGAGIYAIINSQDFKCYVGSSKNIALRAVQHKTALNAGNHPNKKLQKDCDKKLRFVILQKFEDISDKELRIAEKVYMIGMMLENFKLYNISPSSAKTREDIAYSISCDLMRILHTSERISDSIKNEYGVKPGYLYYRKPENRNN